MSSGESAAWHEDDSPAQHRDHDDGDDDSDYVDDEPLHYSPAAHATTTGTSTDKRRRPRRRRIASSDDDDDEDEDESYVEPVIILDSPEAKEARTKPPAAKATKAQTKARKRSSTTSTTRKRRKIAEEEMEMGMDAGSIEPLREPIEPAPRAAVKQPRAVNDVAPSQNNDGTDANQLLSPTSTPLAKPTPHRRTTSKSRMPQSAMPLLLPKKNSKVLLVEVDDPKLDLSGDTGAVGRLKVNDNVITVDLKGNLYKGSLVSCNSMLMVQIGNDSARIESVIDSFLPATPCGNIFDSERLVHGTCDVEGIDIDADVNVNNDNDDVVKGKKRRGKK